MATPMATSAITTSCAIPIRIEPNGRSVRGRGRPSGGQPAGGYRRRGVHLGAWSERIDAGFAGTDPDHVIGVGDPDLAVADLVGAGRLDDGVHHRDHRRVVDQDLNFDLGRKRHLVLGAPVDLGMTPLAAEALGPR